MNATSNVTTNTTQSDLFVAGNCSDSTPLQVFRGFVLGLALFWSLAVVLRFLIQHRRAQTFKRDHLHETTQVEGTLVKKTDLGEGKKKRFFLVFQCEMEGKMWQRPFLTGPRGHESALLGQTETFRYLTGYPLSAEKKEDYYKTLPYCGWVILLFHPIFWLSVMLFMIVVLLSQGIANWDSCEIMVIGCFVGFLLALVLLPCLPLGYCVSGQDFVQKGLRYFGAPGWEEVQGRLVEEDQLSLPLDKDPLNAV